MSRTFRSFRRGCFGDLRDTPHKGPWWATKDGPSNIGPDRDFKKKYRRKRRAMVKRTSHDMTPVDKRCVLYNFW